MIPHPPPAQFPPPGGMLPREPIPPDQFDGSLTQSVFGFPPYEKGMGVAGGGVDASEATPPDPWVGGMYGNSFGLLATANNNNTAGKLNV